MRPAAAVILLFGLLLNIGFARVNQTVFLQPTRLEAFAGKSTAKVTWSKEVGRIDSSEARVVITALVVEDVMQSPYRMAGIRIDLANQDARDQVFLDDTKLEAIKKALDEIERGKESFRNEPEDSPYRYLGAAEFWHPGAKTKVHTLNAAYYIAPDSSGLSLHAYKGDRFRFPDHSPSELSAAIGRAMDKLKQR